MIFGNWEVTDFGIIGLGKLARFEIAKEQLVAKREEILYDWLIHIAGRENVTELNVYEFNAAFVYALSFFNIDIPSELSFSKTFEKQIQIISQKEEDGEF
jgi:hypothetical protein